MKLSKQGIDRAVTVLAAVAAPALTLCIHEHALSALAATDVAGIVTAAVAAYHGGATVHARYSTPTVSDRTP